MNHPARLNSLAVCATIVLCLPSFADTGHSYLDDANQRSPQVDSGLDSLNHGFPRVLVHALSSDVPAETYSKYDFIDAHGTQFGTLETVQSTYDRTTKMLRHISARAYQSYAYGACVISGGIAFESTTPASQGGPQADGCGVYAGHWLYEAGTTTRQAISESSTTIPVADASRMTSGSYVVIYDAPAGSFRNAEHSRVTAVNKAAGTISVARGYKSSAKSHPVGAIVAEHVIGQGSDKQLWAFNMSSQSPRDSSGKTFGEFYADWIGKNLVRHGTGQQTSADVAGVLFDADFYFELTSTRSDANNDLVVDNGISPHGANWLGAGLDEFYQRVAARLPGKYLVTGVHDARGYHAAHGTQMENWLDFGNGDFDPNPKYDRFDDLFATYLYNLAERNQGPALVHNLTKTPTRLYPGKTGANSNAPFRLALATTLMGDGYFGTHSNVAADAWYDEYAVDVQKGSPSYGKAVPKSNVAEVRRHRGWLGKPVAPFRRIYDEAAFAASKNLVGNGNFDAGTSGWTGDNASVSREAGSALQGSGALKISPMVRFVDDLGGAGAKGPAITVSANQTYTVAVALRASSPRDVRVSLGNAAARVPVGTKWRRYVLTLEPTQSSESGVRINVGREEATAWADEVYVFRGADPNVFAREFEKGMVLANATSSSKTISVGSNFQRIDGTQDRAVNNGEAVTSVTLAPWDAVILVRRENVPAASSTDDASVGSGGSGGSDGSDNSGGNGDGDGSGASGGGSSDSDGSSGNASAASSGGGSSSGGFLILCLLFQLWRQASVKLVTARTPRLSLRGQDHGTNVQSTAPR